MNVFCDLLVYQYAVFIFKEYPINADEEKKKFKHILQPEKIA